MEMGTLSDVRIWTIFVKDKLKWLKNKKNKYKGNSCKFYPFLKNIKSQKIKSKSQP